MRPPPPPMGMQPPMMGMMVRLKNASRAKNYNFRFIFCLSPDQPPPLTHTGHASSATAHGLPTTQLPAPTAVQPPTAIRQGTAAPTRIQPTSAAAEFRQAPTTTWGHASSTPGWPSETYGQYAPSTPGWPSQTYGQYASSTPGWPSQTNG